MTRRPILNRKRIEPQRTTVRGAIIGFHFARGLSATDISNQLNDGTSDATIRSITSRANLPRIGQYRVAIPVSFQISERDKLQKIANSKGVDIGTILYRIAACSLLDDDLYDAITDRRFDPNES